MIKQSVLNTFNRVGINADSCNNTDKTVEVFNRFGGGSCTTTELIAYLIEWVYKTSNAYERGATRPAIADFDRIRYFILEQDNNAYYTCID